MSHYKIQKKADIIKKQKEYYTGNKGKILNRQKSYYYKNRDYFLEKQREYNKTHDRRDYLKQYKGENKEKLKAYYSQPYIKFKDSVRNKTRNHYKKINICMICGKEGKTEFHHPIYNPDFFQEVCIPCHKYIERGRMNTKFQKGGKG
jgi:hypothetical protein